MTQIPSRDFDPSIPEKRQEATIPPNYESTTHEVATMVKKESLARVWRRVEHARPEL